MSNKVSFLHLSEGEIEMVRVSLGLLRRVGSEDVKYPEFEQVERWFDPVSARHGVGRYQMSRRHLAIILNAAGIFRGLMDSGVTMFGQDNPETANGLGEHAGKLVGRLAQTLRLAPERLEELRTTWTVQAETLYQIDVAHANGTVLKFTDEEGKQLKAVVDFLAMVVDVGVSKGAEIEADARRSLELARDMLALTNPDLPEGEVEGPADYDEREFLMGLLTACGAWQSMVVRSDSDIQQALELIQATQGVTIDPAVIAEVQRKVQTVLDNLNYGPLPRSQA